MKKFLLIMIMLIVITGCSEKKDSKTKERKDYNETEYKGEYEILSDCNIGRYDKTKRGYYIDTLNQPNAPYWYIITMGEKNTGGYSIQIVDVKQRDDKVVVKVKETSPEEGAIVTQAFTYPTCCIKFEGSVNIEIENTEGQTFNYIGN